MLKYLHTSFIAFPAPAVFPYNSSAPLDKAQQARSPAGRPPFSLTLPPLLRIQALITQKICLTLFTFVNAYDRCYDITFSRVATKIRLTLANDHTMQSILTDNAGNGEPIGLCLLCHFFFRLRDWALDRGIVSGMLVYSVMMQFGAQTHYFTH